MNTISALLAPGAWTKAEFSWRRHASLLLVLVLIAGGLHGWLLRHTVVMSRDGIGFLTFAWRLKHEPWQTVLRQNTQHPLYPAAIALASGPVSHFVGGSPCDRMMASAQWVGVVCGVLIVIPMYFLGVALFDGRVGFWTALLFQCFPIGTRATADALSEGLFLLVMACACVAAVYAVRRSSWRLCTLCGVLSGLAYLTRPEGAAVAASVWLVVLGRQLWPAWRQAWRPSLACLAGVMLGAALTAAPYVAVTGHLTGKETALESVGLAARQPATVQSRGPLLAVTGPAVFLDWGRQHRPTGVRGLLASAWLLATEMDRGFHHAAWIFVALGLYWFGRRLEPGAVAVLGVCVVQGVAVCGLIFKVGYLADRHVLVIVMGSLFWGVAAVFDLPQRLVAARPKNEAPSIETTDRRLWRLCSAPSCSIVLLSTLAVSGLPKTLQTLHPQRAGHRIAGEWLAAHARQGDMVEDPYYWAAYYAGWDFGLAPPRTPNEPGWNHYIIVERSAKAHVRLSLIKDEIVNRGTVVFRCPLYAKGHGRDEVEVRTINFTHDVVKPPPQAHIP